MIAMPGITSYEGKPECKVTVDGSMASVFVRIINIIPIIYSSYIFYDVYIIFRNYIPFKLL